ncbi:MAG: hypothetical protein ICV51_05485 [Flavisolibacter sp.]|nr:hypothetical protein [Flavisolibacter sp.]MBD0375064.1 hypothetical protein [Flavisolibacter sp.]
MPACLNSVRLHIVLIACTFVCLIHKAQAQYKVQGTVYDSSHRYPIEAVTVQTTSGKGTYTDANGFYKIDVGLKDSIWFSYLGKPTVKFPVLKIPDVTQFNIALQLPSSVMKEIKIIQRNYKLDSLQNRKDYAKVFDYRKPNMETMTSIGPMGAGVDLDELIRLFQFRKNKNMLRFQERLLQQEQDKYIDHRFSKSLVHRLTGLDGEELEAFMQQYRPTYDMLMYTNEYSFQLYIKKAYEEYKQQHQKKAF